MFTTYLYTIISVCVVSCISFIGLATISIREDTLRSYVFLLVSLAIGALLGDAFIHLIPESLTEAQHPLLVSLSIIAGILFFFIIEKALHWHHHGNDHEQHANGNVGRLVLISDGFHNFIDGLIIAMSYLVSTEVGIATTIAVIAHEIPQEIGHFGVLLYVGYSRMRALWLNFLSALTAILGALTALLIGQTADNAIRLFIPITAGGFIYIALSDLIPQLQSSRKVTHSFMQFTMIIAGVGAMVLLLLLG